MDVISLEHGRVFRSFYKGHRCILKKTRYSEYDNILKASTIDERKLLLNNQEYSINLPSVYSWDEDMEELCMEYLEFDNLELLLRSPSTHNFAVAILNDLYAFFITHEFFWLDFAPRNIGVEKNKSKIYLFDFEKGFLNNNDTNIFLFQTYEEYSAFLYLEERRIQYEIDINYLTIVAPYIPLSSKRVRSILDILKLELNYHNYMSIYSKIQHLQIPINGTFPIVEFERVLTEQGYNAYAIYMRDMIMEIIK